jgi:hypothetical protein
MILTLPPSTPVICRGVVITGDDPATALGAADTAEALFSRAAIGAVPASRSPVAISSSSAADLLKLSSRLV